MEIDLFHSTRDEDSEALQKLAQDAKASNVRFHVLLESKHGRLTGDRIREVVPIGSTPVYGPAVPPALGMPCGPILWPKGSANAEVMEMEGGA